MEIKIVSKDGIFSNTDLILLMKVYILIDKDKIRICNVAVQIHINHEQNKLQKKN